MTSSKMLCEMGCCTAWRIRAFTGSTPLAKCLTKSSSGSHPKPCSSTIRCSRDGVGGPPPSSAPERLALVQAEGRDVDEANDVGRVAAERGDDVPAVAVAGDNRRAGLPREDLSQPCDVVSERGLRELRRGDVVARGLQRLDDALHEDPFRPRPVDKHDVRPLAHGNILSILATGRDITSCEIQLQDLSSGPMSTESKVRFAHDGALGTLDARQPAAEPHRRGADRRPARRAG